MEKQEAESVGAQRDTKPCWCMSRGAGEAAHGGRRQLGEESMIGGQKPDQKESDVSCLC